MADELWTIRRALEWTEDYLKRKGDAHARASAQWLMQEATQLSRIQLFMEYDKPLSTGERKKLRGFVTRRGTGEPLQYITGRAPFRFLTLKVRPGVLIPRPETELLVGEALKLLPPAHHPCTALGEGEAFALDVRDSSTYTEHSYEDDVGLTDSKERAEDCDEVSADDTDPVYVLDLCTGSGCIACALAYEHPFVRVVATDISSEAIALARENASDLGLGERISFIECDLADGIDASLEGKFALIVSNPPYVPHALLAKLDSEVSDFEPALALDGGTDGLAVFERILLYAHRALVPGGALVVELHETCLEKAHTMAVESGFVEVAIVDDLARKPRVLVARTRL